MSRIEQLKLLAVAALWVVMIWDVATDTDLSAPLLAVATLAMVLQVADTIRALRTHRRNL